MPTSAPTDPDQRARLVDEFRTTGGSVSGPLASSRVLLLTTTDATTGEPVTTPVAYLPDDAKRSLLVATPDDAGETPAWFDDLRAEPMVGLETGTFDLESRAEILDGAEHEEVFERLAAADPELALARERLGRPAPVVALHPVSGRPAAGTGWGNDLKVIHDGFRRELALVRREVAGSGPRLAAQLKINCVMLCGGLSHHHRMEGLQMLPVVQEKRPQLTAVVERLQAEHDAMALLLDELTRLLADDEVDPAVLLPEVERLTTDVEAHLDYEEEQLIPTLNELVPG